MVIVIIPLIFKSLYFYSSNNKTLKLSFNEFLSLYKYFSL